MASASASAALSSSCSSIAGARALTGSSAGCSAASAASSASVSAHSAIALSSAISLEAAPGATERRPATAEARRPPTGASAGARLALCTVAGGSPAPAHEGLRAFARDALGAAPSTEARPRPAAGAMVRWSEARWERPCGAGGQTGRAGVISQLCEWPPQDESCSRRAVREEVRIAACLRSAHQRWSVEGGLPGRGAPPHGVKVGQRPLILPEESRQN